MNVSLLASLLNGKSPEEIERYLSQLSPDETDQILHSWELLARPEQIAPEGNDWSYWLYLAGRGAGKTRSGAEWIRQQVKQGAKWLGFIAPTQSDIRSVMIEGQSGIMACCWEGDIDCDGRPMGIPDYEPTLRHRLTWANGATAQGYSSEEPDRLRGPQHEALWCDELAAWGYARETWDMAMFGLRIGQNPRAMISTTPKPIPLLREILKSPLTVVSRSSTSANRANLAPSFLRQIVTKYEGTRLGRQELAGELLSEMEGALWTRDMVDAAQIGLKALIPAS